jgi:peptidoglycan/xylan/chitin deacetylase (PgdA/CDA1 family)
MYHEVSRNIISSNFPSHMTPMYNIPESLFDNQMNILNEQGYKGINFDDIYKLDQDGKYAIITFDDGLAGNVRFALPILKKYGFKAVFFVTVDFIGKANYMDWSDLKELVENGMSVQSHTMSHPHLQTLSDQEIRKELTESKEKLESKLHTKISSLSFPHGSYNKKVIEIARDAGYKTLCTSEVKPNDASTFRAEPAIIGRLTITRGLSLKKFIKLVEYNQMEICKEKLSKESKNLVKRIIGINNYGKLYRAFFNIKSSS